MAKSLQFCDGIVAPWWAVLIDLIVKQSLSMLAGEREVRAAWPSRNPSP